MFLAFAEFRGSHYLLPAGVLLALLALLAFLSITCKTRIYRAKVERQDLFVQTVTYHINVPENFPIV